MKLPLPSSGAIKATVVIVMIAAALFILPHQSGFEKLSRKTPVAILQNFAETGRGSPSEEPKASLRTEDLGTTRTPFKEFVGMVDNTLFGQGLDGIRSDKKAVSTLSAPVKHDISTKPLPSFSDPLIQKELADLKARALKFAAPDKDTSVDARFEVLTFVSGIEGISSDAVFRTRAESVAYLQNLSSKVLESLIVHRSKAELVSEWRALDSRLVSVLHGEDVSGDVAQDKSEVIISVTDFFPVLNGHAYVLRGNLGGIEEVQIHEVSVYYNGIYIGYARLQESGKG
ncbi:MAG: hypothetical protein KDD53_12845, partial [Bdellovibrionales bacterium]|nr:hypothetical protein [Bdellovibrionales bacterium]